jgi:hypothetical protein
LLRWNQFYVSGGVWRGGQTKPIGLAPDPSAMGGRRVEFLRESAQL